MIFNNNFLIITAHPDDLEIGCGGLVSKVLANGGSVTNLILIKPSAEHNEKRNQSIVKAELEKSKNVLNFETIIYGYPGSKKVLFPFSIIVDRNLGVVISTK